MAGPILVAEIPEQYRSNPSIETGPVQLYDYLFLGSWRDSHDVKRLRDLGITGVINCSHEYKILEALCAKGERKIEVDLDFLFLDLKEDSSVMVNFYRELDKAIAFIKSHHVKKGKVLLHCNDGVCRAPAIALGFTMKEEGITFGQAIAKLRTLPGNPIVKLNNWFKELLDEDFGEMSKYC